jgi:FkbM family methyltransferase
MSIIEKLATVVDVEQLKKDSDINFGEYFVDNRFSFTDEMFRGRALLDIGANIGIFSLFAWAQGAGPIVAIESNSVNFQKLCDNTKKIENIVPVHCAAFNGVDMDAVVVEDGGVSKVAPATVQLGGERVPCKSLAELLDRMPAKDDDMFLKVDIEGAEYDFLIYAAAKDIRRFRTVFLETHLIAPKGERCGGSPLEPCRARTADFLLEYMKFVGYEVARRDAYCWWTWDNGKVVDYQELPDQYSYRLERKR